MVMVFNEIILMSYQTRHVLCGSYRNWTYNKMIAAMATPWKKKYVQCLLCALMFFVKKELHFENINVTMFLSIFPI
jgi:hypothetical protein